MGEQGCAEAFCDQAAAQVQPLVLGIKAGSAAFARSALQFLLLGGVWESTQGNTQLSPPCSCPPLQRGLNSPSPHCRWSPSNNTEIYSSFSDNKTQQQEQLRAGIPSPNQPLWTGSQRFGPPPAQTSAPGAAPSQLVLPGDHVLLQREGRHFCSSSSDFFLFRMAAPSSSSLTSSCLQVLCLFFLCIIFNLDK